MKLSKKQNDALNSATRAAMATAIAVAAAQQATPQGYDLKDIGAAALITFVLSYLVKLTGVRLPTNGVPPDTTSST